MVFPENEVPSISFAKQHFSNTLAFLNTEIHLRFSEFDSFLKILAFSDNCSLRNPVHKPKQIAGTKRKKENYLEASKPRIQSEKTISNHLKTTSDLGGQKETSKSAKSLEF